MSGLVTLIRRHAASIANHHPVLDHSALRCVEQYHQGGFRMGDDRHQKIQQRAYEIWKREGRAHGDPEKHWHQAEAEIERENRLETGQAFTEPSAAGSTMLSAKTRKPRRGGNASSDVLTVETLAMRTGITGDQAQDLIDRLGNDRDAVEEAARALATGQQNFSK
jgi:hypothetical protein